VQPVSVLQTGYSLFERDVEQLFPVLDELGIGFVAYSPLDRGFITGTAEPAGEYDATDVRNSDPRWAPGTFEKNVEAVNRLSDLAASEGITVSQLALAWLLTAASTSCPSPAPAVPGASSGTAVSGRGRPGGPVPAWGRFPDSCPGTGPNSSARGALTGRSRRRTGGRCPSSPSPAA
jgi:hypothetical protein